MIAISDTVARPHSQAPQPGLGVRCSEAQCDGVPCDQARTDCDTCERAQPPREATTTRRPGSPNA